MTLAERETDASIEKLVGFKIKDHKIIWPDGGSQPGNEAAEILWKELNTTKRAFESYINQYDSEAVEQLSAERDEFEKERRRIFHAMLGDEHTYSATNDMVWLIQNRAKNFDELIKESDQLRSQLAVAKTALENAEGVLLVFQRGHDENGYIAAEKAGNIIDEALKKLTDEEK